MTPGTSAQLDASLSFVQGDEWGGFTPPLTIQVNGSAPLDDAASAKMQFRASEGSSDTLLELSTADSEIIILSASGWTFNIPAQTLDLLASTYVWGFKTIDINGVGQTYLEGKIVVLPPVVT